MEGSGNWQTAVESPGAGQPDGQQESTSSRSRSTTRPRTSRFQKVQNPPVLGRFDKNGRHVSIIASLHGNSRRPEKRNAPSINIENAEWIKVLYTDAVSKKAQQSMADSDGELLGRVAKSSKDAKPCGHDSRQRNRTNSVRDSSWLSTQYIYYSIWLTRHTMACE